MTKEDRNYYEKAFEDFDHFCDEFENAAKKRFQGIDDDSRQPIDNAEVERVTPTVVQEIDDIGGEGFEFREPPVNVQATTVEGISETGSRT